MLDVEKIRDEFPVLNQKVHGKPLIYFDNAATNHKPVSVINCITDYYSAKNSNIHRGVHTLSQEATLAFEQSRETVRNFINAEKSHEIIFTKGTTDSINMVASSFGKKFIHKDDEVIISVMEHHSNIVPWQLICEEKGAKLKVVPIFDNGELDLQIFEKLISERTRIISLTHVSNALGSINPVKKIIEIAHNKNIPVLIDGAQAIAHCKIDIQDLDCDFYCFSGHKIYGPMGTGVLYGKEKWLDAIPPYQGGGEMIKTVSFEKTTYNELPFKFEAGTPNVSGFIGLEAALKYVSNIGMENISIYEDELLQYATQRIMEVESIRIFGNSVNKAAVLSFLIGNIHPFDAGTIIDHYGVAVRTGHHCAQPLMDYFKIQGTIRASFAFYNKKDEIDVLIEALKKVKIMFE